MDSPIFINWMSPLSFLGVFGVIFISFFHEISLCKQNSPRWDAAFCGITSGAILFANVPHQAYIGYCKFGNFRVTFISRIFYLRIISEFLNSRVSVHVSYRVYSDSLLARTLNSRGNQFANISEN